MPILKIAPEDLRNPEDSKITLLHNQENGKALKPDAHSHLVVTGRDPATTPRRYPISK